jgi:PAS domain S-box-containing protein
LAIERAGLDFVVDCASLDRPAYIDHALWEKVVLNLLSNALKFTFDGRIAVRLRASGVNAELEVSDTGTGIPAAELPHVFERFRRVPGSRSRTHEGSGIGLALVCEIVKMHGGTVDARSVVGEGTTFTVRIPLGKAHLDPTRIQVESTLPSTALGAEPFVAEALRWLPGVALETAADEAVARAEAVPAEIAGARIIVADDNADMRAYITRLLSQSWRVEAVADGDAALAAARREQPDLVLTDVMMPGLDGFGLLRELRADPALASTPVLMLSARAGEEAGVEGLQAGADDYLVKPFSSRELLARVSTHLQLHRSREHLDLALQGADLGAWDWNVQTGEFVHNARWAELRGYSPEELPQRGSLFHAVHPDDVPGAQQALREHFDGRRPEYRAELRIETKDGGWIWIVQRGKVFARDGLGRPLRMAGTSLEITGRKRTEMEQQFLAALGPILHKSLVVEHTVSALADVVVRYLADYCVIDLIEDSGEIRRAKVACSLEKKRELADEFARLPLGGQRTPILLQVLKGGTKLLFETVASADLQDWALNEKHLALLRETEVRSLLWVPLLGRDRILGGFCLASATTARQYGRDDLLFAEELARRASLSLENSRLYRAAERAIAARDEVLAVVAHDLRNPLGAIVMQANVLQKMNDPESRGRKASERIDRAAGRMQRLIQDLLDVTRVDAGQLPLERARLRIRDVLVEVVDAQKTLAASSSIELRVDLAESVSDVFADRHRMLQVFENLIGNAIKFTPAGGRITLGLVAQAEAVLCYVRDTGRGISAEDLPHLFDRFWQPRRSREETGSGAGLGLPIVKGIVAAHGGRIWVESAPGEGSTFYFTIPTTAPREISAAPPNPQPTDDTRTDGY